MSNRTRERQRLWKTILKTGQAMEKAGNENDWVALNGLIEKRLKLLQEFFAEPIANSHTQNLKQIQDEIQVILDQTEKARNLTKTNQNIVAASLRKLTQTKTAIKNYQT